MDRQPLVEKPDLCVVERVVGDQAGNDANQLPEGLLKFVPIESGQFLYVSAQNDLASGCIKVQILKRGSVWKESESCGAYVIADAYGSY